MIFIEIRKQRLYRGCVRGEGGTPPQKGQNTRFWRRFLKVEKTWKSTLVLASIYRKMRLAIAAL
jgi:hypothetical protein